METLTQRTVAYEIMKKLGISTEALRHFQMTGEPFVCSNTFIGSKTQHDRHDAKIIAEMKERGLEVYGILEEKCKTAKEGEKFCRRAYLFVPKYHMAQAQKNLESGEDILSGVLSPIDGYGYTLTAYVTQISHKPDPWAEHGDIQVAIKEGGLVRTA